MEASAVGTELTGRVGVVTGAGSGVGRAIAEALAAAGASVCLVGRTAASLDETAARLGDGARCYPTDVTDDGAVRALVERLTTTHPSIDVLVHGAGVHAIGTVEHAPVGDLDAQYRTNVRAPFVLTQALLPALRRSRGQVVFVNSSAGLTASNILEKVESASDRSASCEVAWIRTLRPS